MYNIKISSAEELDAYSEKKGNFFQTSAWSLFKDKYDHVYITGTDEIGETVLSCVLFLIKVKFTPFKLGYTMRGPQCDLSDHDLVEAFTSFLKRYMKENHVVYIAIDPYFNYKTDFNVTEQGQQAFDNLRELGYIFNPDKAHSIQRMTNYRLVWDNTIESDKLEKTIFSNFEKKLQNDINIGYERGLVSEKYHGDEITPDVVDSFFDLLKQTSENKNFGIRSKEYYQSLFRSMKKYITLYFYRYDGEKDLEYTLNIIDKVYKDLDAVKAEMDDVNTTDQKKERLNNKKKELEKQLNATKARLEITEKNMKIGYLSTYLNIRLGEKSHDFYGANSPVLRELRLTSNYWDMLKDAFASGCSSFDMGGTLRLDTEDIKKDKTYDLYQYKSRYHGVLDEFIGEFYLVNNKFLFDILHNRLHYLRRVLFKN